MKHVQTIQKSCLRESAVHGGCGECQASCQSACKTSCTVANQQCAQKADMKAEAEVSPVGELLCAGISGSLRDKE